MPLHADARLARVLVAALVLAASLPAPARAEREAVQASSESPGPAEIARALAKVKADPNLATEQTIKTLQWNEAPDAKPFSMPAWLDWIADLFRWIQQSARLLVWCAVVVLAALLAAYLVGIVRSRGEQAGDHGFVAPSHVRDLDIRPESLPRHIGAAARALWERGEQRASLALLYRGMLSRLAHVHRVPIRDSSTEGDCLALAANHLAPGPRDYASRLVGVWQRAVYGRQDVESAVVYVLCDDFASALDAESLSPRSRRGVA